MRFVDDVLLGDGNGVCASVFFLPLRKPTVDHVHGNASPMDLPTGFSDFFLPIKFRKKKKKKPFFFRLLFLILFCSHVPLFVCSYVWLLSTNTLPLIL
jgi:hypothetical protein